MPTALFISPHLDDAAFSCGGTLIKFARARWQVVLCTTFTASVERPTGFALACQTDKGLASDVDYMALRRAEDAHFAALSGATELLHLGLAEAPHRGYESAAALRGAVQADDDAWREAAACFVDIAAKRRPSIIFAPQAIGLHVDHVQTARAVRFSGLVDLAPVCWYRDVPYAIHDADAPPCEHVPRGLMEQGCDITRTLKRKVISCGAYVTQLGFQFGGPVELSLLLREYHRREALRMGLTGAAEALLVPSKLKASRAETLDDRLRRLIGIHAETDQIPLEEIPR